MTELCGELIEKGEKYKVNSVDQKCMVRVVFESTTI